MRTAGALFVAMLAVTAVSCTSIRPVTITAGEQCFRCRRTIADARLAAEQITGFVEKFRTPGCLAKYVVNNPVDKGPIFATYYTTGTMMDANAAFFVPIVVDDYTGERDYRAYALKADADAAAAELKATPIGWTAVLDKARGS